MSFLKIVNLCRFKDVTSFWTTLTLFLLSSKVEKKEINLSIAPDSVNRMVLFLLYVHNVYQSKYMGKWWIITKKH